MKIIILIFALTTFSATVQAETTKAGFNYKKLKKKHKRAKFFNTYKCKKFTFK